MHLKTPVALFVYKRPELTREVFSVIAGVRLKQLFIIADGPKSQSEEGQCREVRAIVERIDWPCDVSHNMARENLGCRQRLASGLDWVFSQVDEAIILEDDCLPDPSFFRFCETLLQRYRDDDRIMEIAGSNWQLGQSRTDFSYYFSKHSHTWGWATWKRAWRHYDEKLSLWPTIKGTQDWDQMWDDPREKKYWEWILDRVHEGDIDTWDYQWQFAMWIHKGLSAVSNVNLVSNIGFGREATHTSSLRHPLAGLPRQSLTEICHSPSVSCHKEADKFLFEEFLWESSWKRLARKAKHGLHRMRRNWL
jgi:hypothetical protein